MIFCMQHFDLFGIKQPVLGNIAMLFLVWKEAFCNGVGLMIELCGATSQGNVLPAGPRVCRPSVALLLHVDSYKAQHQWKITAPCFILLSIIIQEILSQI